MSTGKLKVLVVDDSALYRKVTRDLLAEMPDVEVVSTANNGRRALELVRELKPDLLTLDVEMPELDGLEVLSQLRELSAEAGAIMLSSLTTRSAKVTTQALERGAFDFVVKPATTSPEESVNAIRGELIPKVKAFIRAKGERRSTAPASASAAATTSTAKSVSPTLPNRLPRIVAIGVSTGGPQALGQIIPKLALNSVPIVVVQHMPPNFTRSLAEDLDQRSQVEVREAESGDAPTIGTVLIAPGGKQMKLVRGRAGFEALITDDPPEKSCRPSVDYLFRSVAECFGADCLGLVLTGMGDDGTAGAQAIKREGGAVWIQEGSTCVVNGMPRSVAEAGAADRVVPLCDIAASLAALAR